MKKIFLLSILLFSVLFVNAQKNSSTPEEKAQKKVNRLAEKLDLSATQKTQLHDLYLSQYEEKDMKRKYAEMSQDEKAVFKAERKATKENFNKEFASILTPDQLEKHKNLRKEKKDYKRNKKKGKMKSNRPERVKKNKSKAKKSLDERSQIRVNKMTKELDLNEVQQKQLLNFFASKKNKEKDANKKNLSKEERSALRDERTKELDNELSKILTTAQYESYQNLKAERKRVNTQKRNDLKF